MKKGFTLIELLGILTLLGVIVIVAVPSLIESNRVQKVNEINNFNEIISTACETYASVHPEAVGSTVSVSTLISEGYLNDNLKNPNSGRKISAESGNVYITKNSDKKITCNYS